MLHQKSFFLNPIPIIINCNSDLMTPEKNIIIENITTESY